MAQNNSMDLIPTTRRLFPQWDLEPWFDEPFMTPFRSLRSYFSTLPSNMEHIVPNVDIYEDHGELIMKADLPGMKKEDVEVTLTDGSINISGERKQENEIKKKDYYKWERSYGSFCRSFALPSEVDSSKIKSSFKDGVLEIRMPKTEKAKSKEVKVKIQ